MTVHCLPSLLEALPTVFTHLPHALLGVNGKTHFYFYDQSNCQSLRGDTGKKGFGDLCAPAGVLFAEGPDKAPHALGREALAVVQLSGLYQDCLTWCGAVADP